MSDNWETHDRERFGDLLAARIAVKRKKLHLCVDCRWCKTINATDFRTRQILCTHELAFDISLVGGHVKLIECSKMREDKNKCGYGGKLWVGKQQTD